MIAALETVALGKRYGRKWALSHCSLSIPQGSVTALVGPNGAGKSTLLRLAVGLAPPTTGSVAVFGRDPYRKAADVLPDVAYVAQDRPLYQRLTVAEMLTVGAKLNRNWDQTYAKTRLDGLGINLRQKVGKLSGGQQAQVALVLALAKHPALIVLDEPTASLDPLARREFLQVLMEAVATDGTTVLISSHNVVDLERICDYLVILARGSVRVADELDQFLGAHRLLVGARATDRDLTHVGQIIQMSTTDRQSTLLVRSNSHLFDSRWDVRDAGFEETVLGYLALWLANRESSDELEKTAR